MMSRIGKLDGIEYWSSDKHKVWREEQTCIISNFNRTLNTMADFSLHLQHLRFHLYSPRLHINP
jgi:hypothetical protein